MSQKTRNYFKNKKTYSGDQNHFMDSVPFFVSTDDTAKETAQGLTKLATDANAVLRADDNADGFERVVRPHQLPELVLAASVSHTPGVAIEVGAVVLTPLTFNDGTDAREDWLIAVQTGVASSVVITTAMDVLKQDIVDDNGLYLNADADEFEESANVLQLKDGGIGTDKLVPFGGGNFILATNGSGLVVESSLTDAKAQALGALGNSVIPITTGAGLLVDSSIALAKLDYIDVTTPGTMEASKSVIADANINIGIVKATQLHIGATGAEVQVDTTPVEMNYLAGVTPGTASANKVLIVDASKKIDELDIDITFKVGGTQVLSSAGDLNLLNTVLAAGVASDDLKVLAGIDAGGVGSSDLIKIAGAGSSGIKPSMMDPYFNRDSKIIGISFEAGHNANTITIEVPYIAFLAKIHVNVDKAIEASNDASLTFKDHLGNLITGADMAGGKITLPAGSANNTIVEGNPTANHGFEYRDSLTIDVAKSTVGGTCIITLEFLRVNSIS